MMMNGAQISALLDEFARLNDQIAPLAERTKAIRAELLVHMDSTNRRRLETAGFRIDRYTRRTYDVDRLDALAEVLPAHRFAGLFRRTANAKELNALRKNGPAAARTVIDAAVMARTGYVVVRKVTRAARETEWAARPRSPARQTGQPVSARVRERKARYGPPIGGWSDRADPRPSVAVV